MTDTQIHDRLRDILREELGDHLRNQEVDRVTKHRIVEKVISSLLGAQKPKLGLARSAGQGGVDS